jgi:hypothetical protein
MISKSSIQGHRVGIVQDLNAGFGKRFLLNRLPGPSIILWYFAKDKLMIMRRLVCLVRMKQAIWGLCVVKTRFYPRHERNPQRHNQLRKLANPHNRGDL